MGKIQKIKKYFMTHIKKPYYYVPRCPECGSWMTGRYFKYKREVDAKWIMNESLKNGELAAPAPQIDPRHNVFCMECDHTWEAEVNLKMLSLDKIYKEKVRRGTIDILAEKTREKLEAPKEKKSLFEGINNIFKNF